KVLGSEQDISYFCELKLDGLAIELIYENGSLTGALTRGDGVTGEDVLSNIRTIKSIPMRLKTKNPPRLFEVRGEALMFKKDFLTLNEDQQEAGEVPFANPRNASAGTIRQIDPKIAASRPLRFFGYALGDVDGVDISSQTKIIDTFREWGIPTVGDDYLDIVENAEGAVDYYHRIHNLRKSLPFDIDGMVVKVN